DDTLIEEKSCMPAPYNSRSFRSATRRRATRWFGRRAPQRRRSRPILEVVVRNMELLTSVLALVAAAGAVLLVAARLLAPRVPSAARLGGAVIAWRAPLTLAVAGVATLGSLYFSEVADYVPCRLCWFQRVAMYPIALVAL